MFCGYQPVANMKPEDAAGCALYLLLQVRIPPDMVCIYRYTDAVTQLITEVVGMGEGIQYELGSELLAYLAVSGFFVTVALTYTGALQGTGDTKSPLYISIVSQLVIPIGLCAYLQMTRGLQPTDIWTAIVLGHVSRALLSVLRFRQGKWRNISVDIGTARG